MTQSKEQTNKNSLKKETCGARRHGLGSSLNPIGPTLNSNSLPWFTACEFLITNGWPESMTSQHSSKPLPLFTLFK